MLTRFNEIKTEKLVSLLVAGCFSVLVLSITTCSVHMNMFNPGEVKLKAAEANAKIEISRQEHTEEMERLKVVERLIIDSKVHPIAARCAVEGWKNNDDVCEVLAKGLKPKPPTEEAP
jgi:hypothetical protein